MHSPTPSTDRYVPFKQEGWGIALFVVLLAVVCAGTATYIHKRTYLHPTDTRFRAAYESSSSASHE
ncbi:MAG: hypothetical protein JF589_04800 [Gemmatimonadetes bacterium]|jgi:hypothetical protein|nr:hypothetical protein [Gemmatimonadota bacterium]